MAKHTKESIYSQIKNISSKSSSHDIFIIGKGPSIDNFVDLNFPDGLIININDSEKIIQGDIGIFSSNWVRHSLKEHGFKCKYYMAGKPLAQGVPHAVLPPIPFEYDDDELGTFRLGQSDFYDEPFVLLNALKLSMAIGNSVDVKPNVFLLGFDFSTDDGQLSKSIHVDFAQSEIDRSLMVHSHENEFLQFMQYFEDNPVINIKHVGSKSYSQLTHEQFIRKFEPREDEVSINPPAIIPLEDRVLIVAEFTNNHLGDLNRLLKMVEKAKEAGADLIKVQKRDVDTFYTKEKLNSYYWSPFGKTLGDYRRGVELDEEQFHQLDEKCQELEIGWFCSVLDFPSFKLINKFSPSLIKIPSTISNHKNFHKEIAEVYQGPIVVSTGFTEQTYEQHVLETFNGNEKIYLLHCVSSYPTKLSDCNTAVVKHYAEMNEQFPKVVPGYSSHDIGSMASIMAVANGAKMVEKHVKLGDVDWVHFDKVALDLETNSFKQYVNDIRNAELALGSPVKKILSSEHHKYEVVVGYEKNN